MKNAYILLGSNIGNRLKYLSQAKELINDQIGNIFQVSTIYETDPWGYSTTHSFLNQAIAIRTSHSPHELLLKAIQIEQEMGRSKVVGQYQEVRSYADRTIDIDIIFYDDEIVQTEHLQIPHPRMQERRFVLTPIAELIPNYTHPALKKDVTTLLKECKDELEIYPLKEERKDFIHKQRLPYQYIAVEGNIGAGKTTLSNLLAEKYNSQLVEEEFSDNPLLPKFYENSDKYAFPLELSFLSERYNQLKLILETKEITQSSIIADYYIAKSIIFSKITLKPDEFVLYADFFETINNVLPKPDMIIYLHKSISNLRKNINHRNRSYEQSITNDYLRKVQKSYLDYLKKQREIPVVIVNTNNLDFVNCQKDFDLLEKELFNQMHKKGVTRLFF